MKQLLLPEEDYNKIIAHCKQARPLEACGIMGGTKQKETGIVKKVFLMENARPSSEEYFMDYEEQFAVFKQLRQNNLKLLSIFHSHPHSEARPSQKDIDMANYEQAVYAIISLAGNSPDLKTYIIRNGSYRAINWDFIENNKIDGEC